MKSQLNYFVIFLVIACSNYLSGQEQDSITVTVETKSRTDRVANYNLYFLSKLLSTNYDKEQPGYNVYYSLENYLGSKKINEVKSDSVKYRALSNFLKSFENYKKFVEKSIISNLDVGNFDYFTTDVGAKQIINDHQMRPQLEEIETVNNQYHLNKNKYENNLKKISLIERIYTLNDYTEHVKPLLDSLQISETLVVKDSIDSNYKLIGIKDFQKVVNQKKENLVAEKGNLDKLIDDFAVKYTKRYLERNKEKAEKFNKNLPTSFAENNTHKQQIIINSHVHTAQMQAGSSGLSIPSQSQMIDAMAIFLAKRAKQEAAIWFIDQVRLQMNNPLVMDVFPETIKIIEGTENYKVPTFDVPWKNAIAKDFVEMPLNLTSSPWVKNVIINNDEQHAKLEQSVNFGYELNRLMTEQYNYRDVIRYFYINERDSVKVNSNASAPTKESKISLKINTAINNSATLLYIITNELFAIEKVNGKDVYRLLSYEEISGLSPQEYKILLELIELKYGKRLNQLTDKFSFINDVHKKEMVSNWIGNILVSLSQFDKIRNEDSSIKGEKEKNLSSKHFYNVWSILNKLSGSISDKKLFGENTSTNLEAIQKGMTIYEQFQTNNYVGAANSTFELINILHLGKKGNPVKIYSYNLGRGKNEITMKIVNKNTFELISHTDEEKLINISLKEDSIIVKDKNGTYLITLKDYETIAKYLSNNSSKKKLRDFYDIEFHSDIDDMFKLARSINLDEAELLKFISHAYIVKNAKDENIGGILKSLNYTLKYGAKPTFRNNHQKYYSQLTNLLSFFGDVLNVQDGQQLAGVIDSYALPPTSYKLKRKKAHSIDLNGYVGAFAGTLTTFKNSTLSPQFTYGITAPVGVAFTWSRKKWIDNYGISLDVVDLGNIVNHYLMTPDVGYGREVHFSEVFSLGTTFLLGIRNSPFVLSGGFKFLPLQSFEKNGEIRNNKAFDAGVFHIGLKIDIPLINLYAKDF